MQKNEYFEKSAPLLSAIPRKQWRLIQSMRFILLHQIRNPDLFDPASFLPLFTKSY